MQYWMPLFSLSLSPSSLQVEVGSTLRLDCPVTQLSEPGAGASVMLWKKGHRVLTAGSIKVRHCKISQLAGIGQCTQHQVLLSDW